MAIMPFIDRYKRYKRGTEKLTTWLSTTAQAVARRAGTTTATSGKRTTSDLVQLARTISDAKRPTVVPPDILTITQDVIDGRTICADWYTALAESTANIGKKHAEQLNKSHRHFIGVLEQVQAFLKSAAKQTKTGLNKQQRRRGGRQQQQTQNIFDALDLEEPVEVRGGCSTPSRVLRVPQQSPPIPMATDGEDTALAIWCLLEDLKELRLWVKSIWQDYHCGTLSLVIASKLTNTAFAIMRDLDDAFCDAHPDLASFDAIVTYLGIEVQTADADILSFTTSKTRNAADANVQHNGAMDLFCIDAWCALSDFRELTMAVEEAGEGGTVSAMMLAGLWQGHPLALKLYDIVDEVRSLADKAENFHDVDGFLTDEFTRALMCIAKFRKMSTWFLPAFAAYTEVYNALGMQSQRGRDASLAAGADYRDTINSYLDFVIQHPHHNGPQVPALTKELDRMETCIGHYLMAERSNTDATRGLRTSKLLDALPILAGHQIFETVYLSRHLWSPRIANDKLAVLGAAYLYKAARLSGALKAEWPDMELVMTAQSVHGPLVRESKRIEGFARHYDLALGVEASVFARHCNRKPTLHTGQRLLDRVKRLRPTNAYVLASLKVHKAGEMSGYSRFYAVLYAVARDQQGLSNHGEYAKLLPPVELLATLRKSFTESEVHFHFDYMSFYQCCQSLMDVLWVDFKKDLATIRPGEETSSYHEMVDAILWQAADAEKQPQKLRPEDTMLGRCGSVFDAVIARYGSEGRDKAVKASACGIVDEATPNALWRWGATDHQKVAPTIGTTYGPLTPEMARLQQQKYYESGLVRKMALKNDELKAAGMSIQERQFRLTGWANQELEKAGLDRRVYSIGDDSVTGKLNVALMDSALEEALLEDLVSSLAMEVQ